MLAESPATLSQHAQRMRLVNHEKAAVMLLDPDKLRQIRNVPVHAEQALGHDKGSLIAEPLLVQKLPERRHAVMSIRKILRSRKLYPLDNAVMREGIVKNEIPLPEQGADNADIGGMSADERQSIRSIIKSGQLPFQLPVKGAFPGHQPAGSHGRAVKPSRFINIAGNKRMAVQSQVVVAGIVNVFSVADGNLIPIGDPHFLKIRHLDPAGSGKGAARPKILHERMVLKIQINRIHRIPWRYQILFLKLQSPAGRGLPGFLSLYAAGERQKAGKAAARCGIFAVCHLCSLSCMHPFLILKKLFRRPSGIPLSHHRLVLSRKMEICHGIQSSPGRI